MELYFNDIIKFGSFVNVEYEGEFYPGIVINKIDKDVEVITMMMRSLKKTGVEKLCVTMLYYELDNMRKNCITEIV